MLILLEFPKIQTLYVTGSNFIHIGRKKDLTFLLTKDMCPILILTFFYNITFEMSSQTNSHIILQADLLRRL